MSSIDNLSNKSQGVNGHGRVVTATMMIDGKRVTVTKHIDDKEMAESVKRFETMQRGQRLGCFIPTNGKKRNRARMTSSPRQRHLEGSAADRRIQKALG